MSHLMEENHHTEGLEVPPSEKLHAFDIFYVLVKIPGKTDGRSAESDTIQHYVCITSDEGRAVKLVKMATDTFPGIKYTSSAAQVALRQLQDGIFVKTEQCYRIG